MKSLVKIFYFKKSIKSDVPRNELNAEHLKNCLESMELVTECHKFYRGKKKENE